MYKKFENPIPPESKAWINRKNKIISGPPEEGDTVIFKAGENISFGVLIEKVEPNTIKGEITILGGFELLGSEYDGYKDWKLTDKIEINLDKLDGIIKK